MLYSLLPFQQQNSCFICQVLGTTDTLIVMLHNKIVN